MKISIFALSKFFFTAIFFLIGHQCICQKSGPSPHRSEDRVYPTNSFSRGIKFTTSDNNGNNSDIIRSHNILKEEIYQYSFHKDKIKDSSLVKINYYDTLGNQITVIQDPNLLPIIIHKLPEGSVTTYSYQYDKKGKLIKQVSENPFLFGQINIEYEYDSAGNIAFVFYYNKDTTTLKTERRIYNSKQQVEDVYTKIGNSEFYNSAQYFYEETGKLISESIFDSKGKILFSHYYQDGEDPGKKMIYVEMNNNRRLQKVIFYDNHKRRIKETTDPKEELLNDNEVSDYEKFMGVDEYKYNNDNTFFQWTSYTGGKKNQLNRHYYFKNNQDSK